MVGRPRLPFPQLRLCRTSEDRPPRGGRRAANGWFGVLSSLLAAAAALLVVALWIGVFRDRTPSEKTLWKMIENSELFGLDEREPEDLLPEKLVQLTEVEPLVASDEFLEYIVPSFEEADLQPEAEEGVS